MIDNILLSLANTAYKNQEERNFWNGKKFEIIKKLEKDQIGKVGEDLVVALFNQINENSAIRVLEDHGPVDAIIYGKKCEIKTATLSLGETFTNDYIIRSNDFDCFISLGLAPENIYISIFNKRKIEWDKKGTGFTNRRKGGTENFSFRKKYNKMMLKITNENLNELKSLFLDAMEMASPF